MNQKGNKKMRLSQNKILPSWTLENLALSVDPATGTDLTIARTMRTQAEITAHGAFASLAGAFDALPTEIRHVVTITHADGDFSVAGGISGSVNYFGQVQRFVFALAYPTRPAIIIKSASVTRQVVAAGSLPVASSTTNTITLQGAPGFADNAYRGRFLKVTAGAGVGQVYPITSHVGTLFSIPSQLGIALDASSVIQIHEPATRFSISDAVCLHGLNDPCVSYVGGSAADGMGFTLQGIEFAGASAFGMVELNGGNWKLTQCIIYQNTLRLSNASVSVQTAVFDAAGIRANAVAMGGGYIGFGDSNAACLMRNAASALLYLTRQGFNSVEANLYGIDFDASPVAVSLAYGRLQAHVKLYSRLKSANISQYGLKVTESGLVYVDLARLADGGLHGTTADLYLDDYPTPQTKAWTDVTNATNHEVHNSNRLGTVIGV